MTRVRFSKDDAIDARYPTEWGAKIMIHWQDGTTDVAETAFPKGDPENPLTKEDFIEKFKNLVPLSAAHQHQILQQILQMESISVRQLIATLHLTD